METEMESESIALVMGGIYVALSVGLSEEGIAAANDVLRHLARRPTATLEESRILQFIADAATLKEEPEQAARQRFQVIDGGRSRSPSVGWATASGNSAA
jgi:hypothetical protein